MVLPSTPNVGRSPGSTRHLQHFSFLRGYRGGHARFGIGLVRTIPRERPSTMMVRRVCVRGTSLAFLSAVITCHGTIVTTDDNKYSRNMGDHSRTIRYGYPRPRRMVGPTRDNIHATGREPGTYTRGTFKWSFKPDTLVVRQLLDAFCPPRANTPGDCSQLWASSVTPSEALTLKI